MKWEAPQLVQFEEELSPEPRLAHKIFLVDDDENFGKAMTRVLRSKGYYCQHFLNALSFLEQLRKELPDLVMIDVRMSWIGGMDLVRGIRKNTQYKKIPIVLITGYANNELKFQGFKFGADAFLEKPFETDELVEIINSLVVGKDKE